MNILEQELEEVIWQALTKEPKILESRGFPFDPESTYTRQLELGSYGRADIVGFKVQKPLMQGNAIYVSIIELKKDEINIDTLLQAVRYGKGIEQRLKAEGLSYPLKFSIHLIGKKIATSDFVYMPDILMNVFFYTYSIDLKLGIIFSEESSYVQTNHSLPKAKNELSYILKANIRSKVFKSEEEPLDLPFYPTSI